MQVLFEDSFCQVEALGYQMRGSSEFGKALNTTPQWGKISAWPKKEVVETGTHGRR